MDNAERARRQKLLAAGIADNVVGRRRHPVRAGRRGGIEDETLEREDARHAPCIAAHLCAETAYDLYQRGSGLLQSGHPHQAAMLLSRAKLLEPEKASIREALGRAWYLSGRHRRARREFAKAVQLNPPMTTRTSPSPSPVNAPANPPRARAREAGRGDPSGRR